MTEIIYKIKFHSEWHCGSGLTSGSDLDTLVVRDNEGFPYIPGKTLKGLLLEAATFLYSEEFKKDYDKLKEGLSDTNKSDHFIPVVFGYFDDLEIHRSKLHVKGQAFFSDAHLSESLKNEIRKAPKENLVDYFYRQYASTAITEDGIANKSSLRRMETVIPCELVATISNVDKEHVEKLSKCMKFIKRMGQNRNRGLGRCTIEIIDSKEEELS